MDTSVAPATSVPTTSTASTPAPQTTPQTTSAPPSTPGATTGGTPNNSGSGKIPGVGQTPTTPTAEESFELKIDGKTKKFTRQEILNLASMSHAATSRFEEAAKTRKQVENIISNVKTNPIQALMDPALGLSETQIRDAFEAWYHEKYIEPESLTEDQRRLKQYEAENKAYKEREAEAQRLQAQQEQDTLTEQARSHLTETIMDAIGKSGLPKTADVASRIAFYMREANQRGWEAPIDYIVGQVKKERIGLVQNHIQGSTVEQIYEMIGPEMMTKIRKYELEKLRASRNKQAEPFSPTNDVTIEKPGEKISYQEVTKRLNSLRRTGTI